MRQFIKTCVANDLFNVMHIREVAKCMVENPNPENNGHRESALSRDLFGGRLSEEELNGGIEDDLADLPNIYSDAVLYKVVQTIDHQLSQTQKVSRREQRQYLEMAQQKAGGKRKQHAQADVDR